MTVGRMDRRARANELVDAILDVAQRLTPHPGELYTRTTPYAQGTKVNIAVGMRVVRASAHTLEDALTNLLGQLQDADEQRAVIEANNATRPETKARENVQAPDAKPFTLTRPLGGGK